MSSKDTGKSSGIKTTSVPGGKLVTSFPQDKAGNMDLPNTMGGKFGGSTSNLSHSLKGSSAVQK